jgi:hypothetical protein
MDFLRLFVLNKIFSESLTAKSSYLTIAKSHSNLLI